MKYRANAGVGTSSRLILKGETISEIEYKGLPDRHKLKFVLVNSENSKEPPNRNEVIGTTPVEVVDEKKADEEESQPSSDSNVEIAQEELETDETKTKEPPKMKK